MKIYFGPSPNWWGPFQIADLLQKVGVSEDDCYKIGKWLNENTPLGDICSWVYKRRVRTEKIILMDEDTWNVDTNIAKIMEKLLPLIKEGKIGVPMTPLIEDGMPDTILPRGEVDAGHVNMDRADERWDWIFGEIEWAIHEMANENPNMPQPYGGDTGFTKEEFHNNPTIREVYWDKTKEYNNRLTRGSTLFGKYLSSLNT